MVTFNGTNDVIPRRFLTLAVLTLPVLLVTFFVLMGGYLLIAQQADTSLAAQVLRWTSVICLLLIIIDLIVLVGILAIRAVESDDRPPDQS